jgi:hypothetical protein
MRKLLGILLILGLGVLLVSGCQEATKPCVTIPEDTLASGLATLSKNALEIDNAIGNAGEMKNFKVSAMGVHAFAITITRSADDWFTGTDSFPIGTDLTRSRELNFKVYALNGVEITNPADLPNYSPSNISRIVTYSTYTDTYTGGSYTISFGSSKTKPLTFYYSPTKTIDGPVHYLSSYQGDDYQITFDYGTLGLSASGYPTGSVNWATYVDTQTCAQGGLSFNGTSTATATFTDGGTGTYYVNLDSGAVSAVAGL